jgi:hypothetical protein
MIISAGVVWDYEGPSMMMLRNQQTMNRYTAKVSTTSRGWSKSLKDTNISIRDNINYGHTQLFNGSNYRKRMENYSELEAS